MVANFPSLEGTRVRLERLLHDHIGDLVESALEDHSIFRFSAVPSGLDAMVAYAHRLRKADAAGESVSLVQIRTADRKPVGVTRLVNLRYRSEGTRPYAAEIGGTWLARSAQRTGINREAKALLVGYLFSTWGVARVDFKTDVRNLQSRAALEGIGARLEGVLRRWQPSQVRGEDGVLRDTAIYSLLEDDWKGAAAKRAQLHRLAEGADVFGGRPAMPGGRP